MTFGSIYKIKFPNEKHYIGLTTTSLEQRKIQHKKTAKRGDAKCLYNALRKYDMVDTLELIEIDTANTEEEHGEKMKQYHQEHPEVGKERGEKMKKYWEDNPEVREQMSEIKKKYFEENPEAREQLSEALKQNHQDHPEVGKEHGEKKK